MSMVKYATSLIISILLFSNNKGHTQEAINIDHEIGMVVASSFRLSSEKAYLIDSFQTIATRTGNQKLLAYNKFFKNTWLFRFGKLSTTATKQIEKEIDFVANHEKDIALRGFARLWKGSYYIFDKKELEKGLVLSLEGKKLLEEAHFEKFNYAIYYYHALKNCYVYFDDFKSATQYCILALNEPKTPYYDPPRIYNDLGICYVRQGQYNKALIAFKNAVKVSRVANENSLEAMAQSNIGNILRIQKRYNLALPNLYAGIKNTEKEIPEIAELNKIYVANCLIYLDSMAKAKTYLKAPSFQMPYWSQPNYNLSKFETLALYHVKAENFKIANIYKDSLIALKDSIKINKDINRIIEVDSKMQAESFERERKKLAQLAIYEKRKRNIILLGLGIMMAGLINWINHRRKVASKLLEKANQQLSQYLNNIKEKNELIEIFSQQLEDGKISIVEENNQAYLETLYKSILLTEENWAEFKKIFEQVFPNFFQKLAKKYPILTAAENRLLALEKLSLPDKEMGNMLGISPDSIRKTRYRLRKKYPELLDDNTLNNL
jgi:tetratricopeptide (TPR) repeat protein